MSTTTRGGPRLWRALRRRDRPLPAMPPIALEGSLGEIPVQALTADKHALLTLLARHGHTYDELAAMVPEPAETLRARAAEALAELVPLGPGDIDPEWRDHVVDYVLGQQSPSDASGTSRWLDGSESARQWTDRAADTLARLPRDPAHATAQADSAAGTAAEDLLRAHGNLSAGQIRQRAISGALLLAVRGLAIRLVAMGGNIVVARLLAPRDFGLIAIGTTIVTFGGLLSEFGMGAALVRGRHAPSLDDLRAVQAFQFTASLAFALVVAAVAVPIGEAGQLAAIMVAGIPLMALGAPAAIVLERTLSYRVLMIVEVLGSLVYTAWAVATVASGWGVWGLATAVLAQAAIGTVVLAALSPVGLVTPSWSWRRLRPLLGFGARFQAINVVNLGRDQGLNVGIAAIAGIATLGLWMLVYRLLQILLMVFQGLWRVSFPAMSQLIATGEDPRPFMERGMGAVAVGSGFFLAPLAGCAPAAIPAVVGHQWHQATDILPGFCLGLMIGGPVSVTVAGYLFAVGDAGVPLRATVLHTIAMFAVAFALLPVIGPWALGFAQLASSLVDSAILGRAAARRSGLRILPTLRVPVMAASAAGGAGWLVASGGPPTLPRAIAAACVALGLNAMILAVLARPLLVDAFSLATRQLPAVRRTAGSLRACVRARLPDGPGSRTPGWPALIGATAALVAVALVLSVAHYGRTSQHLSGSDSVGPDSWVAAVPAGHDLCVDGLWLPAQSSAVILNIGVHAHPLTQAQAISEYQGPAGPPTSAALTLSTPAGVQTSMTRVTSSGPVDAVFPVRPDARQQPATICLRPVSALVEVAGTWTQPFPGVNYYPPVPTWRYPQATVDGRPISGLVAVRYSLSGSQSTLSLLGKGASRAALFRPGFVGSWTFIAIAVIVPVLWLLSLAAVLRARAMRRARALVLVGLIAFANAAIWAVVTPAFDAPDEESHVAYAVHLGQTGQVPPSNPSVPYASTEEQLALAATYHYSSAGDLTTRPPWTSREQRAFDRIVQAQRPSLSDGSGAGATGYPPVYYAVVGATERLVGGSFFDRLFAMRLTDALLGAITVMFVFATVRELLPGVPWAPPVAALAVAFQPMFAFISGSVNEDVGAELGGAVLLYLLMRALRRGLTPRLGAGIAAAIIVGTLAKVSVLALVPAAALALVIAARRGRVSRRAWLSLVGTGAALIALWAVLAPALGASFSPYVGGQSTLGQAGAPGGAQQLSIFDRISYLWQTYLPPLPFMHRLYTGPNHVPAWDFLVRRVWGSFGWLDVNFTAKVYDAIAVALLVAAGLIVRAVFRHRREVRARAPELAVLILAFLGLLLGASWTFARKTPEPYVLEQGRYLFPALATGAVAAVGACYGVGRRWAPAAGVVLLAGMLLYSGFCELFVFTKLYT